MVRLSVLSATLVGVLFLGFAGCGGTGKRTVPEAGSSDDATLATGGQSGQDGGIGATGGSNATDAEGAGGARGGGSMAGANPAGGSGGNGGAGGSGSPSGTGGAGGSGTGTNTGTIVDAGADSGKDAPVPTSDLAPDLEPIGPCTGQGDFTPCVVVTTPDRKYDICVAGVCVSPGCGDSTCNVPGPHFPLADTDERTCSNDSTGTITCPTAGQAYYGQDAQYGWDSLHAESERFTRSLSVSSQPVVLDNVTGLTWQGCAAGLTSGDCSAGQVASYTWEDAVAYCDTLDWGSYQDWHLPDPYELDSIADATMGYDTTAFPAGLQSGKLYWSSSSSSDRSSYAWVGEVGASSTFDKTVGELVRCVRGKTGSQPTRFTLDTSVAKEPVVVDNVTGLTWQGCVAGLTGGDCATGTVSSLYWIDALSYCVGLSWGGNSDWRLPNWKELRSIVDDRLHDPAIDASTFPATPQDANYWSSTSDPYSCMDGICYAWYVAFGDGDASSDGPMTTYPDHVRCVRGGI